MMGKRQYQILCAVLKGACTEREILTDMSLDEINSGGKHTSEAQMFLEQFVARRAGPTHLWYNTFNRSLQLLITRGYLKKTGLHGVEMCEECTEDIKMIVRKWSRHKN